MSLEFTKELTVKKIEELSDLEVARLLMRKLWQRHDLGGISMGRSLDNRILEAVMSLVEFPKDLGVSVDLYSLDALLKDSERRGFERGEKERQREIL